LRTQPRAERAADKRRHHAHIVRLYLEHAAQIALHVLHALGLVIDRELAVAVPHHRRGIQLHRIVVLDRDVIFGLVAHGGGRIGPVGLAAPRLFDHETLVAPGEQVGAVRLVFVFDAHQRSREAGGLPLLGQHQGDRLIAEQDLVVVERTERRAFLRRHVVRVGRLRRRHGRPIFVGEHVEHAFDPQRLARIDARDTAFGDCRGDHGAISEAGHVEFAGVFRRTRDLGVTVDA